MSTTAHSPNRKERDPAKRWRAKARGNAIETKKDRIVDGVAIGKTLDQAAIEARMSPEGLRKLIKTHPGLKKRIEKAEEEFEEQCSIAKGEVGSRIVRITSRVGDTVLTSMNEKIIIQGGLAIMRGCGVLPERTETEIKGIVGIFNADDLAREYRETKKRLAEAGNEPLGVSNGTSKDK